MTTDSMAAELKTQLQRVLQMNRKLKLQLQQYVSAKKKIRENLASEVATEVVGRGDGSGAQAAEGAG